MPHASICLEITSDCTLDCTYCFRTLSEKDLTVEFLDANSDTIARLASHRIVISGGEPLIHRNFPQILNFLRKRFPTHTIAVTTGLCVAPGTIDDLLKRADAIDEYLLNFETSNDDLLDEIKRRKCAALVKQNLRLIAGTHPKKTRVNIVLSSHAVVTHLPDTLAYLAQIGVKRIKFFRDVRVTETYRISTQDIGHLLKATARYDGQIQFEGLNRDYLLGQKKVPEKESSQALCVTARGEILEREERDAYAVLEQYHNTVGKFTKHLKGWSWPHYLYSRFVALALISLFRICAIILLVDLVLKQFDRTKLDTNFITYIIPLYAIYVTIWTSSLWGRRSEILDRFSDVFSQYFVLSAESKELVVSKLTKQLALFPATWDRYENVLYLKQVYLTYGGLEAPEVASALRKCVLNLANAIDHVKAYEQYEDFRYFGRGIDKATGLLVSEPRWRTVGFYVRQALLGDKRTFPYVSLLFATCLSAFYLPDVFTRCIVIAVLFVIDYFCVENLSKLNLGLFSISRNLAVKLFYQMGVNAHWEGYPTNNPSSSDKD